MAAADTRLQFFVKEKGESLRVDVFPHVVLARDTWDDYGFKTTFAATLTPSRGKRIELGSVKILRRDQSEGYTRMPKGMFRRLAPTYCSLGGSSDYYEQLIELGPSFYKPYLRGLRDVVYDPEILADFQDHDGFRLSLLRFSGSERTIRDMSERFQREATTAPRQVPGFRIRFSTRLAEDANEFEIPFDFTKRGGLPNRINIVLGYNGTGKTRLLSNLAVACSRYGYENREEFLQERAGRFVGAVPPPFKRVIVVSYSAFDSFAIPGRTEVERARLRHEGELFGYVYCGLRERSTEAVGKRRQEIDRLKNPAELRDEFGTALSRIRDHDRLPALSKSLYPLLRDASFQRAGLTNLYSDDLDIADVMTLFNVLSSGHKIVLKMVTELTSHLSDAEATLVLIDEPETHLHPPLLAALLKSIRICLEEFDGYAIIATHSPVVAQETPARYVRVLRRVGSVSSVAQPTIETFGENIGIITQDVFNLDDGSTDWHDTLDGLAKNSTLNQIEEMFGTRLGFGPRSYVATLRTNSNE